MCVNVCKCQPNMLRDLGEGINWRGDVMRDLPGSQGRVE